MRVGINGGLRMKEKECPRKPKMFSGEYKSTCDVDSDQRVVLRTARGSSLSRYRHEASDSLSEEGSYSLKKIKARVWGCDEVRGDRVGTA